MVLSSKNAIVEEDGFGFENQSGVEEFFGESEEEKENSVVEVLEESHSDAGVCQMSMGDRTLLEFRQV